MNGDQTRALIEWYAFKSVRLSELFNYKELRKLKLTNWRDNYRE
jgi:hypothetical protein